MDKFDLELELLAHMDAIDDLGAQVDDENLKQYIDRLVINIAKIIVKIKGCENEAISR